MCALVAADANVLDRLNCWVHGRKRSMTSCRCCTLGHRVGSDQAGATHDAAEVLALDPPVVTTPHVLSGAEPVRLVYCGRDDTGQFSCLTTSDADVEAVVVHFEHLLGADGSLEAVRNLPPGGYGWRILCPGASPRWLGAWR
jgi:hypothetical protein